MRKVAYLLLLSMSCLILTAKTFAQQPKKDSAIVMVYRLDSAAVVIKDSLQKQNKILKEQVEKLKEQIGRSADQLDSLETQIGKSTDKINQSFKNIAKQIDSIPQKVTNDNIEKSKEIIAVIPFYCGLQMYCIIQKKKGETYDIILFNRDTIPSKPTARDSIILKRFATESKMDYTSFQSWLKKRIFNRQCCKTTRFL